VVNSLQKYRLKKITSLPRPAALIQLHPSPTMPTPPTVPTPPAPTVPTPALSKWSRTEDVRDAFPEGCAELKQFTTIITGPTTGIGAATTIALAAVGGRVVLAARSQQKAEALMSEIVASVPDAGPMAWIELDLSSLESVEAFADKFAVASDAGGWPLLKCVVCNAGMFNMAGKFRASADGFEETFAVNHLGHFLLTKLLMPRLVAAAPSRVVLVSSGSHFGPLTTKEVANRVALRELASPDEAARAKYE